MSEAPIQAAPDQPDDRAGSPERRQTMLYLLAACLTLSVGLLIVLVVREWFPSLERGTGLLEGGATKDTLLSLASSGEEVSLPLKVVAQQADVAVAAGDLQGAVQLYERALELGGDVQIMRRLFDTAVLLGDRQKAESVLGLLSFRGVGEEALDALRGLLLLREGDAAAAKEIFERSPVRPDHAYGLALADLLLGHHEAAQESLALVLDTQDPLLVHAAQVLRGAYDEFALFQDGKETHRKTLLARALAELGEYPSAAQLLTEVVSEDPGYRDAWIVLGYSRLAMQQVPQALETLEAAYLLDPEKAETQYFLALAHERRGSVEEAKTFFEYALQNGFQPARLIREKLAAIARAAGAQEEAMAHYRAMLEQEEERDPTIYQALITLVLEREGGAEEARRLAQEARDTFGDTPLVLDLVGWTALVAGDVNEAATFLTTSVQQDPSSASAWYHKGLLEEQVGDKSAALASFRKAYELALGMDPDLVVKAATRHNALVIALREKK